MNAAQNNTVGNIGEKIAVRYLQEKGYTILHINWRADKNEIDIIATQNNFTIFVEVKTSNTHLMGNPEERVGKAKIAQIQKAAIAYLEKNPNLNVRCDVIAITLWKDQEPEIAHFIDAF